jgi:hypothetical protein
MAAMIRRLVAAMSIFSLFTQLTGCSPPTNEDVVGIWASQDGGQLSVNADGTFAAQSLPRDVFFDGHRGDPPVTGEGNWKLEKVSGYWQIRLSFRRMPEYPQGFYTSALVAGSVDSIALFRWVEEEGGQRYELTRRSAKQQSDPPAAGGL